MAGTLSAGQVSLGVKPDATGFGAALSAAVKGESAGIGGALGGVLMTGLKTFAAPLAALGAGLSIKHIVDDSTKAFMDLTGSVKVLQRVAGGSIEQVSGLRGAMQLAGVDSDNASGALTIFSKNLGLAHGDAAKTAEMTAKLGTSFLDAAGNVKPMSDLLPGLADKFKTMPEGAEKVALATQLFGRSGAQMIPFLNKGSEGIGALTEKAKTMGLVIDDVAANAFVNAKVSARNFDAANQGLKVTLGGELVPVLTSVHNVFRNAMTPAIEAVTHVLQDHRGEFLKVAGVIDGFGQKVAPVATNAFTFIGNAVHGLSDLLIKGDFSESFRKAFHVEEDSPLVSFLLKARDAAIGVGATFKPVFDGVMQVFASLGPVLMPLLPQVLGLASSFSPLQLILKVIAPIMPAIISALTALGQTIGGVLATALPLVVGLVGSLVEALSGAMAQILPVVVSLVQMLADAFISILPTILGLSQTLWSLTATVIPIVIQVISALIPVFAALIPPILQIVTTVITALMPVIVIVINLFVQLVQFIMPVLIPVIQVLGAIITVVFQAIGNIVSWLLTSIIIPVVGFIILYVQAMAAVYTWLWQNIISPVFQAIGAIFTWLWNTMIMPVINFIIGGIHTLSDVINTVFGAIGGIVTGAFSGVESVVRGIFNTIIGLVNGVIDGLNGAGDLARTLTNGAVNIHLGHIPQLAEGGIVPATPGGRLVRVAEGGQDEIIGPLDKVRATLGGGTEGKGDTYNIYEAISPRATAMQVARRQNAIGAV
ncbi:MULTISPECIES: phage tail tape measure protein [unclassified Cryobacterium]|uniref:phage tail tape measure protein n=1 Tax=unclassified Cryobacterium TaxID=2649013 RepID=UPI00106D3F46|nr:MULTISPECIES: phage tail tape measure protein [unclassified Cryobacterium]TFB96522.1 phage tail tape measure protein [Cryobacterium sp. MDB2-A-1]TFC12807.1 phage tail tape measure protein [Cryobacterium sp. MDB2-A-2]